MAAVIPPEHLADVQTLWDYMLMHHEVRLADVGVGLGSHDPTVPQVTVDLFHQGTFPYIVFTGANAPTTIERYPRGEAVHLGEYALEHGVPEELILLEKASTTTAENFTVTQELLASQGKHPKTVIVVSRPYQQRRAYPICRQLWPEVEPICAGTNLPLDQYVQVIDDVDRVINMIVGDFARLHFEQDRAEPIPAAASKSFDALRRSGYVQRLKLSQNS